MIRRWPRPVDSRHTTSARTGQAPREWRRPGHDATTRSTSSTSHRECLSCKPPPLFALSGCGPLGSTSCGVRRRPRPRSRPHCNYPSCRGRRLLGLLSTPRTRTWRAPRRPILPSSHPRSSRPLIRLRHGPRGDAWSRPDSRGGLASWPRAGPASLSPSYRGSSAYRDTRRPRPHSTPALWGSGGTRALLPQRSQERPARRGIVLPLPPSDTGQCQTCDFCSSCCSLQPCSGL